MMSSLREPSCDQCALQVDVTLSDLWLRRVWDPRGPLSRAALGRAEPWKHLRTSNAVELPFAAVRLRTAEAKRYKKVENATAVIWKIPKDARACAARHTSTDR